MTPDFVIFTDGSVRRYPDQKVYSGYSVVVLNLQSKQYTGFCGALNTSSIVYAEAWAVYRGLQYINKICKPIGLKPSVLVVTDNKLNVTILSDYIFNTWDTSDWGRWKKTDGSLVKNQEVYRNIIKLINRGHMSVRYCHINSHLEESDWKRIRSKLLDIDIDANQGMCKLFIQMNQIADEMATEITASQHEMTFKHKKIHKKKKKERNYL